MKGVTQTDKGWIVRWRMGGRGSRQHSRLFRKEDGFTEGDAIDFKRAIERRKRMGGADPLAGEEDFLAFVDSWWRTHRTTLKPSTQEFYERTTNYYIRPFFRGARLCDIGPDAVDDFRVQMDEQGVGVPMQLKVLTILQSIFTKAKRDRKVLINPVAEIEKPTGYRQRIIQPFPPERVEALRGSFLADGRIEDATLISMLAYSGPRPGEALALTWADISTGQIIYRGEKTGRDRTTRLLRPLADDLATWRKESGVAVGTVFGWNETRFRNWRRRQFKPRAEELTGITRPYDLRHAFATLLAGEGRLLDYISRQMGNSPASCERWYRHLIEDVDSPQDAEERIYEARRGAAEKQRRAANG